MIRSPVGYSSVSFWSVVPRPRVELLAQVADRDNPPSRPRTIAGIDAIREYLTDVCDLTGVCDRDMIHQVRAGLVTPDRIAFELACSYPDGTRVTCMCIACLADGRIAWHHQVRAWDN